MSELQFDRAEFGTAAPSQQKQTLCDSCRKPIVQSYYTAERRVICSNCREAVESAANSWSGVRFARAFAAGLAAAIGGAIVWWAVRHYLELQAGIISIGIGIAVGRAVLWGSRNRGGVAFQILAVLLTYFAVAGNYIPDIVEQARDEAKQTDAAAKAKPATANADAASGVGLSDFALAIGALLLVAAAVPFMQGGASILGLLIIGFGLINAWKIPRRRELGISGPFAVTNG